MKTNGKRKTEFIETICALVMILLTCLVSYVSCQSGENWTALLITPYRFLLYFFGPCGAILFCFLLYRFSTSVSSPLKRECIITACCMPAALLFVFDPMNHPIQSSLHLLFSYLFFFLVNFCFIKSLFMLHLQEVRRFKIVSTLYLTLLVLCSMLYIHYMSINTWFELLFTVGMTLILHIALHYNSSRTKERAD